MEKNTCCEMCGGMIQMGVYLNSPIAYGLFQEAYSLSYYVDKTDILSELVPLVDLKKNSRERTGDYRGKGMK